MTVVTKDERAAVRMTSRQKHTIDSAASVTGQSFTDFMVQASMQRAHEVLADQRVFHVEPERWNELLDMATPAPQTIEKLADLFSRPSALTKRPE
jgi:uncharacterized protein (DUF1778 family)